MYFFFIVFFLMYFMCACLCLLWVVDAHWLILAGRYWPTISFWISFTYHSVGNLPLLEIRRAKIFKYEINSCKVEVIPSIILASAWYYYYHGIGHGRSKPARLDADKKLDGMKAGRLRHFFAHGSGNRNECKSLNMEFTSTNLALKFSLRNVATC